MKTGQRTRPARTTSRGIKTTSGSDETPGFRGLSKSVKLGCRQFWKDRGMDDPEGLAAQEKRKAKRFAKREGVLDREIHEER